MRDEIDGRIWVEHHEEFSASIARRLAGFRLGLERLHAIRFDAPWQRRPSERTNAAPDGMHLKFAALGFAATVGTVAAMLAATGAPLDAAPAVHATELAFVW